MRSSMAYVGVMRYRFWVLLRVRETRRSEGWRQRAENTACVPAPSSSRRWCSVHQRGPQFVGRWEAKIDPAADIRFLVDFGVFFSFSTLRSVRLEVVDRVLRRFKDFLRLHLSVYAGKDWSGRNLDGREDHGGSGVWLVRVTEERLTSKVRSLVKSTRGGVKPK